MSETHPQQLLYATPRPPARPVLPPAPGGGPKTLLRRLLLDYSILLLTLVYFLIALLFVPDLASPENLRNVFLNMLPLLVVAIGQTIVLITGGIDLSVTSILAITSVAGAWIMNDSTGLLAHHTLAVPAAINLMLAIGVLIGLFNGFAVTVLVMPPFIVTLATMMCISGLAIWSTQSRNIANLPDAFCSIAYGGVAGIPYAVLSVAFLAIAAHLFLSRTLPGQWIYAVGHNAKASRISGVPVRRVIVAAYAICGLCAAVASVLYTARLETGSPTLGREILLDVVGATVIGGTSLFGGKGKILWTVFGVLLFSLIANTLNLLGLQHFTIMMVKGGVILVAALFDLLRIRLLAGT